MLDGGCVAQGRASTVQPQKKCMQPGRMQPAFTVWWKNEKVVRNLSPGQQKKRTFVKKKEEAKKHQTEWCATANKYRCLRCGRSSKHVKMQGECQGPKWLREGSKHKLGRWSKSDLGGHDMVRRVDRHGDALIWCRNCSGYARQKNGT